MTSSRGRLDGSQLLVLFGLGVQFQDCYRQLVLSLGRAPDLLCDNDPAKWGRSFFGIRCISPAELSELGGGTAVVITVRKYEALHRQLRELRLKDLFVACFDRGYDLVHDVKALDAGPEAWPSGSAVLSAEPDVNRPERVAQGRETGERNTALPVQGLWTLVTGASRGVGRQIALEMARLGSHVVVHSRQIGHTKELVAACAELGVQVVAVAAELDDLGALERMLDGLERSVPQIDIVFNNAAISHPCGGPWSVSPSNYLQHYAVNAVAPILICNRLLPAMIRRGFGRVVNVSSTIQKRPGELAYACSKAALSKYVHDLAPSLEGTGVMMSLLCPGFVRSDMGGAGASHPVESVLPGALLGALMDGDVNGRWFIAQDYAGLELPQAIERARFYYGKRIE